MNTFNDIIKDEELKIYQKNKKKWLDDDVENGHINEKTKITYWRLLNTHILKLETWYMKDLMKFTSVEIINAIKSSVTNSPSTKRSLYAAINNYLSYCVKIGEIFYNPCDTIDPVEIDLFSVNKVALKKSYMPLKDFYKYINRLCADDVEKMVYVLIRYGVPVNDVPNVKWEDLNEEKMILTTTVKKKIIELPIDKAFVERVNLCKACSLYKDGEYIIKTVNGEPSTVTRIYGIIDRISKTSGVERPDIGMLFKNRRYDLVLKKYKKEEQIELKDLKAILEELGLPCGNCSLTNFRKELRDIFDLEVKTRSTRSIDVINIDTGEVLKTYNSIKELVEESEETFGFYIDKAVVGHTCKGNRNGMRGLTFRYSEQG